MASRRKVAFSIAKVGLYADVAASDGVNSLAEFYLNALSARALVSEHKSYHLFYINQHGGAMTVRFPRDA